MKKRAKKPNIIEAPLIEQIKYNRAEKRVRALRNFYRHLTAYAIVCILLLILYFVALKSGQDSLMYVVYGTAVGWTIGLVVHIFIAFGASLFMGKSWEEKKMNELMEKENHRKAIPHEN